MYHILQDKRAQRSAQRIWEGLVACLRQKPFDRVSITDIQKASFVSRATFYRLFDSLEDVLAYRIAVSIEAMLAQVEREPVPLRIRAALAYWMQVDPSLLQALRDCQRADILIAAHNRYKERVLQVLLPDLAAANGQADCILTALISLTVGILIDWLENGHQQSEAELYARFTGAVRALAQRVGEEADGQ